MAKGFLNPYDDPARSRLTPAPNPDGGNVLSKEQFRAQFKRAVTLDESARKYLAYCETLHGYKLYRCLELILLEDENGQLWSTGR